MKCLCLCNCAHPATSLAQAVPSVAAFQSKLPSLERGQHKATSSAVWPASLPRYRGEISSLVFSKLCAEGSQSPPVKIKWLFLGSRTNHKYQLSDISESDTGLKISSQ